MLRYVPGHLPHLALTFVALCAIASTGCSGVSCDAPHCPKDPLPTVQMTATCNNAHATKCSGKYDDWVGCIARGTTCDLETETSDSTSHTAAVDACKPKYEAYVACAGNQ